MKNRILLVEDNPDDAELTLRALKKNKLVNEVVIVHDGAEAIEYLFGPRGLLDHDLADLPAVMLLDLKLPRVGGHEVLNRVRSDPRTRFLPVVILTSSSQEEDIITSYQLGANSYVRKPVEFEEFSNAVNHLGLYWLLVNQPAPITKK
jgi:two-component system response regulator